MIPRPCRPRPLRAGAALLAAMLTLAGCETASETPSPPDLQPVAFADLPGWTADRQEVALRGLLADCERLALLPQDESLGGAGLDAQLAGHPTTYAAACRAARMAPAGDAAAARRFFETWFAAYRVDGETQFTGYYEPVVAGSMTPTARFRTPVYGLPRDLVTQVVTDADGKQSLRRGRRVDGDLVPYYTRAEIDRGALGAQVPLLYVADAADLFFLQIQGSGRVSLPDGSEVRLAYAGRNGQPYVALGKLLVERGELASSDVSMQSIRGWMTAHPDLATGLMEQNPNYVFFRIQPPAAAGEMSGAPGTLGVGLQPLRSAAVDRAVLPLAMPLWVDTTDVYDRPLRRLVLAQDTGADITGARHVDLYFGWGAQAAALAGPMHANGALYVLLPRPVEGPATAR
ncbi:membrane-bound lytic murein transglycosylase A [Endobacter medicaginis]|uniref:peptidoglycan lytic exotransglycosylase n=4 Tax=Endobacter medicaginis TaxID=1181271 RepID=A0A839V4B7_9PROT|nr:murein transglycosylase A [Endobacter medicaginis]MBB3174369.1 membrane-bound lytic murein transglycosylase A [Endobacter medicaginis]MCX5475346.1 murein transglycosylase A [Endobacter medicaginis]